MMFLLLLLQFLLSTCLRDCSLEIVEVSSFLQYRCRNTSLFKCPFTDEYYSTSKKLMGRISERTASAACQNDTRFYQACGLEEVTLQTGDQSTEGSLCGYLCKMIANQTPKSLTGFLYVNDKVTRSVALAWSPVRDYRPESCNGAEECLNTDLDERGCENQQRELVS